MSEEIVLGEVPMDSQSEIQSLRSILYEKYGENENMKRLQGILTEDLEKALNLVVDYQRCLRILRSPDPTYVEARRLLTKYKMVGVEPSEEFKIYADGVDITLHPDSIESTSVVETTHSRVIESEDVTIGIGMLDLPEDKQWENEQGIETAELVADDDGNVRLRPVSKKPIPGPELEDDSEPETIDPDTRIWLTKEDDEPTD